MHKKTGCPGIVTSDARAAWNSESRYLENFFIAASTYALASAGVWRIGDRPYYRSGPHLGFRLVREVD